jgi:hypothetical protein
MSKRSVEVCDKYKKAGETPAFLYCATTLPDAPGRRHLHFSRRMIVQISSPHQMESIGFHGRATVPLLFSARN